MTDNAQERIARDYEASTDPRRKAAHGVVVTPIEIVDFITRSVRAVVREEFGVDIDDDQVQILDPFAGTGIFAASLLTDAAADGLDVEDIATRTTCIEINADAANIADTNLTNLTRALTDNPTATGPRVVCADTFRIDPRGDTP